MHRSQESSPVNDVFGGQSQCAMSCDFCSHISYNSSVWDLLEMEFPGLGTAGGQPACTVEVASPHAVPLSVIRIPTPIPIECLQPLGCSYLHFHQHQPQGCYMPPHP